MNPNTIKFRLQANHTLKRDCAKAAQALSKLHVRVHKKIIAFLAGFLIFVSHEVMADGDINEESEQYPAIVCALISEIVEGESFMDLRGSQWVFFCIPR